MDFPTQLSLLSYVDHQFLHFVSNILILVKCSMYNPSDIDNIDYVVISSVSHSSSLCIGGRI